MKKRKIKLGILFLLCFGLQARAQQVTVAAGGGASSNGGTINHSIGQLVYTSFNTASGSTNPGIQLPYEIYVVGVNETDLNVKCSIYPNPSTDNLTIVLNDFNEEKLVYELYDTQGKLLECRELSGNETKISMSTIPNATYILNILQENTCIQSFKIIKN